MSEASVTRTGTQSPRRSPVLAMLVALVALAVVIVSGPRVSSSLTINNTNHWRDTNTPNTVGFFTGDVLFFGALSVLPGGAGTTVSATQGGVTLPLFHLGGGVGDIVPGQYGRSISYNPALTGSWSLTATRGLETAAATTPAPGSVASMPFANNVAITGTGTTPTISWAVPAGANPDLVHIGIFDDEQPAMPRKPVIFASGALSPASASFTIPPGVLEAGHRYVARVSLVETYGHVSGLGNQGEPVRSRSNAFFSLVPLSQGAPDVVFLPVVDGSVFRFDAAVEQGVMNFYDPPVAIGYRYAIGEGDPNFASVLLPSIGDGQFNLFGCDGSNLGSVNAGSVHSFGPGGIGCFRVTGIETSAGLDPQDPTAFPTGITFTDSGRFTGTMAPEVVPEPTTLLLFGTAAAGIGLARWRQRRRQQP